MRWWVKKAARQGVVMASALSGAVGRAQRAAHPHLRVLTYHRFGRVPRDPYCISEAVFDRQMAHVAEAGTAIGLDDLLAFLHGRASLPQGAVLVTIDDGFRSTLTIAHKVLRRRGVPAVAFVTPSLVDVGGRCLAGRSEPYLTWEELRRLADDGVEIGSHAWTHRSMGRLEPREVRREACRSREVLEQRLRRPVLSFAYPYGTRADCSTQAAQEIAGAGYQVAFTSQHGPIQAGLDPFLLPRIKIEAGDGLLAFRLAARGGLDAWRYVDRWLWRIQSPKQ